MGKSISYLFNVWSIIDILWYNLLLAQSTVSCLIHPLLFKFELTWDIKTTYWYSFSSIIEVFFYRHTIYYVLSFSHTIFSPQDISWFCKIQGHFQDLENEFCIFQDAWEPCTKTWWIVCILGDDWLYFLKSLHKIVVNWHTAIYIYFVQKYIHRDH